MAAFKLYYLLCDARDCDVEFDGAEPLTDTLRQQAEAEGWITNRRGGGRDLCPAHVEQVQ